jgi:transcription termination factor Rho
VLEVLPDGFGFLRSPRHDFEPGPDDIYVSPSQVRRLNLKQGHQVAGPVRPPRRSEKYLALLQVEAVNGGTVAELARRIPFDQRTPVLPTRRLPLAHDGASADVRLLDLLAPWGRGQRVLIQAPPGSGRTLLLTNITRALLTANPDLYAVVCVVDERPEEVTELRRRTGPDSQREVVASTFDQPPGRHIALAEMALARAQRMVEAGRDVLLVLDSLTALARALHQELPPSGRMLTAGLDAGALLRPKRLFGAARQLEGGGSLTVIATVLTGTDSRVDQVIAEEFAGKGNSDVVLAGELAALHIYPAIDPLRTGTRREDCLLPPTAIEALRRLRARLQGLPIRTRLETVSQLLARAPSNQELLAVLAAEPN